MNTIGDGGSIGMPTPRGLALGHLKAATAAIDHAQKHGQQQDLPAVAGENEDVRAYRQLNVKAAALAATTATLADPAAWQAVVAHASSDAVVATAHVGAEPGTVEFSVDQLAAAHSVVAAKSVGSLSEPVTTGPVEIALADRTVAVEPRGNSLHDVVEAINRAGAGVKATAVEQDSGRYALQVTASSTGAASAFTVNGVGALTVSVAGADARATLGKGADARTVTSPTNTFTNLVPGIVLTAARVEAVVSVSADPDPAGIAARLRTLVKQANGVNADVQWLRTRAEKGMWVPEAKIQELLSSISHGGGSPEDLAKLGVRRTGAGQLTHDDEEFLAAYKADPATVQQIVARVAPGLARHLQTLAAAATSVAGANLGTAPEEHRDDEEAKDVSDTVRVNGRDHLLRGLSNLQKSLRKMDKQSRWLAHASGRRDADSERPNWLSAQRRLDASSA